MIAAVKLAGGVIAAAIVLAAVLAVLSMPLWGAAI